MSDKIGILISGQLNASETIKSLNSQIDALQNKVKKLNISVSSGNVSQKVKPVVTQLNNVSKAADDAKNKAQGFFNAFGKVAQWGIVTGSIYGSVRALKGMVAELVNIDTRLVELRRVTSSGFDIAGTLKDSVKLSSELGNNLNDVLQTVNDVARAGDFTKQQIMELTRVATIASNVSDLKPQDAMSDLIATMRAYRIEASQTMDIVDKMNEVDNNFSISTLQIAESLKRASATAVTFGVDINHLIADTTAIGEVTQESGSVLGNSLKTIYSRLTTVSSSINALKDLGIEIKNSNGEMRSASDILDSLASRWQSLSKAQQEQSAVAIAG